jgi:hypothetical protein
MPAKATVSLLALTSLGDAIQMEMFLLVLHRPRNLQEVHPLLQFWEFAQQTFANINKPQPKLLMNLLLSLIIVYSSFILSNPYQSKYYNYNAQSIAAKMPAKATVSSFALTALCDATQMEMFLFVLHRPRNQQEVQPLPLFGNQWPAL